MGFLQGRKQHLLLQHGRVRGADGCRLCSEGANRARDGKGVKVPGIAPGRGQPFWQSGWLVNRKAQAQRRGSTRTAKSSLPRGETRGFKKPKR